MKLKKRLNFRQIFTILYSVAFVIYLLIGLTLADATHGYSVDAELSIPSINLISDVTPLQLTGDILTPPDTIVGSYSESAHKTLLLGHSNTVFQNLKNVKIHDRIYYHNRLYTIIKLQLAIKDAVDMDEILAPADSDTLVIMTCDGFMLSNHDATHRFIVTAILTD